jgi:hypothetical protein
MRVRAVVMAFSRGVVVVCPGAVEGRHGAAVEGVK